MMKGYFSLRAHPFGLGKRNPKTRNSVKCAGRRGPHDLRVRVLVVRDRLRRATRALDARACLLHVQPLPVFPVLQLLLQNPRRLSRHARLD